MGPDMFDNRKPVYTRASFESDRAEFPFYDCEAGFGIKTVAL